MPIMRRMPGIATNIAYKILGRPANMSKKDTKAQKTVKEKLDEQESTRVR